MEYRTLGRTGLKVSPLGLGTSNFGDVTPEGEARRMIERTLDAGVNLIDLGHIYGDGLAERIVGDVLKENGRRHEVLISTKIYPGEFDDETGLARVEHVPGRNPNEQGLSRAGILNACDAALRRLQTNHIDLYQTHRPDFGIPVDETLRAFDDLVRAGKVRYIGCSTYPAWSVMEALMVSELKGYVRFSSEQAPYNLLDRRIENELIPLCRKHGLGILAWAPLGMGGPAATPMPRSTRKVPAPTCSASTTRAGSRNGRSASVTSSPGSRPRPASRRPSLRSSGARTNPASPRR